MTSSIGLEAKLDCDTKAQQFDVTLDLMMLC
jgi:hypothetical protein